jgi:acyl-CoA reductase-like NAD-dependent aldehyde dehydrogenase
MEDRPGPARGEHRRGQALPVHADRVAGLVADAVEHGARVAAGGGKLDRAGYFYAPTILAGTSDGVPIVDEEQFGPALPVISYGSGVRPDLPFGGHKWSGIGVENGSWGLHGFTETQVITGPSR